jgi:hypothetical protein
VAASAAAEEPTEVAAEEAALEGGSDEGGLAAIGLTEDDAEEAADVAEDTGVVPEAGAELAEKPEEDDEKK